MVVGWKQMHPSAEQNQKVEMLINGSKTCTFENELNQLHPNYRLSQQQWWVRRTEIWLAH
jgi:hypothetical protein